MSSPTSSPPADTIFTWVRLDPCDPPQEILLEFFDGSGWEHRAFWGTANLLQGGAPNTAAHRRMGPMPPAGEWVRLEIPASLVGVTNVYGMRFVLSDGHAWWDRVGHAPSQQALAASGAHLTRAEAAPRGRRRAWWARLFPAGKSEEAPINMSLGASYVSHSSTERRYSIYSPALQLLAETATTSASAPPIAHEYIWFGGEPLAQVETTTGAVHWYFTDHLGAPVLTTDATGSIDWRVEREPYGAIYAVRAGAGRHQPLGLPGQEYDASSDRQYNVFRWYRAGWGRYTQSDPVGVVQLGFVSPPESRRAPINHLFGYVNASPTGAIDPLGLKPCASGQCSDCPSGVWTVEETSSVAYLTWGFEWEGTSTYRCWGNKLACSVYSKCQALGGGWTVGAGAGFGWIGGKTCSCAEDVTKTSSISGGAGPGYATWSTGPKCSGLTAGVATNFVKLSVPSAYLAGVVCSSKSMGCTK